MMKRFMFYLLPPCELEPPPAGTRGDELPPPMFLLPPPEGALNDLDGLLLTRGAGLLLAGALILDDPEL